MMVEVALAIGREAWGEEPSKTGTATNCHNRAYYFGQFWWVASGRVPQLISNHNR